MGAAGDCQADSGPAGAAIPWQLGPSPVEVLPARSAVRPDGRNNKSAHDGRGRCNHEQSSRNRSVMAGLDPIRAKIPARTWQRAQGGQNEARPKPSPRKSDTSDLLVRGPISGTPEMGGWGRYRPKAGGWGVARKSEAVFGLHILLVQGFAGGEPCRPHPIRPDFVGPPSPASWGRLVAPPSAPSPLFDTAPQLISAPMGLDPAIHATLAG